MTSEKQKSDKMSNNQLDQPTESTTHPWVLPGVTAAILTVWEAEGRPAIWPYALWDGAKWVRFAGPEALQAATVAEGVRE